MVASVVKYVIPGAFLALMIVIGYLSGRKVKTADDFILGGCRMGPWLSSMTYGTTYFSAFVFVGYAGRRWPAWQRPACRAFLKELNTYDLESS